MQGAEGITEIAHNAINYTQQATQFGISSLRDITQDAINYTHQTVQLLRSQIGLQPSSDSLTPENPLNQNTQQTWENIVKKGQENIDKVQEIAANAEKQIQFLGTENEQVHKIAASAQEQIQNITTENIQEMIKDSTQRTVSLE
jgi:methyl-accepting chemotaxis protein